MDTEEARGFPMAIYKAKLGKPSQPSENTCHWKPPSRIEQLGGCRLCVVLINEMRFY